MGDSQIRKAPYLRGLFLFSSMLLLASVFYWKFVLNSSYFRLEVIHVASGQTILELPVSESETFEIWYTHSVDRLPVREVFQVVEGELVLEQVYWMSFGAGLGYMGQGRLKVQDEWVIIEQMNRRVDKLLLRVGTIADHRLVYRGEEHPFRNYVEGMELLQLRIKPCRRTGNLTVI